MAKSSDVLTSSVAHKRPDGIADKAGQLYVNTADQQLGYLDNRFAAHDLIAIRFWSAESYYEAGDFVIYNNELVRATTKTTQGSYDPHQWENVRSTGTIIPWLYNNEHPKDQIVIKDGQLWRSRYDQPALTSWDSSAWVQLTGYDLNKGIKVFESTAPYRKCEVVIYNNDLWLAKHDVAPGAFNLGDWKRLTCPCDEIVGGGGGDDHTHPEYLTDAPVDGTNWVRRDAMWVPLPKINPDGTTDLSVYLRHDGTVPMSGNLNMGGRRVMGLGEAQLDNEAPTLLQVKNLLGGITGARFRGAVDVTVPYDTVAFSPDVTDTQPLVQNDWIVIKENGQLHPTWIDKLSGESKKLMTDRPWDGVNTFQYDVYEGDDLIYDGNFWHYIAASALYNRFVNKYGDEIYGPLTFRLKMNAPDVKPDVYAGGFDIGVRKSTVMSGGETFEGTHGLYFDGPYDNSTIEFATRRDELTGVSRYRTRILPDGSLRLASSASLTPDYTQAYSIGINPFLDATSGLNHLAFTARKDSPGVKHDPFEISFRTRGQTTAAAWDLPHVTITDRGTVRSPADVKDFTTNDLVPKWYVDASKGSGTAADLTPYLKHDGSVPMTGALNMGAHKITGVATATANDDAPNWLQTRNLVGGITGAKFRGAVNVKTAYSNSAFSPAVSTADPLQTNDWIVVSSGGVLHSTWIAQLSAQSKTYFANSPEAGTANEYYVNTGDDLIFDGSKWHFISASALHNKFVSRFGDEIFGPLKFRKQTSTPGTYIGAFDMQIVSGAVTSGGVTVADGNILQLDGGYNTSMFEVATTPSAGYTRLRSRFAPNGSLRLSHTATSSASTNTGFSGHLNVADARGLSGLHVEYKKDNTVSLSPFDVGIYSNGNENDKFVFGKDGRLTLTTYQHGYTGNFNDADAWTAIPKRYADYLYSISYAEIQKRVAGTYDANLGPTGGYVTKAIVADILGTSSLNKAGPVYSVWGILTNTAPSDRSLKKNIAPLSTGLAAIMQLKPSTYEWADAALGSGINYGLIADEVETVIPDIVESLNIPISKAKKAGAVKGLREDALLFVLINAVQELNTSVQANTNKLKSIEDRLRAASVPGF